LGALKKRVKPCYRRLDRFANIVPESHSAKGMNELYAELHNMGADIDAIKKRNPTEKQLRDLANGLSRLRTATRS
jgi:hypothetical protein